MKKNKNVFVYIILVIGIFILSGCARGYFVAVDSISDGVGKLNKVYQILPGNKDTSVNDLQFKEFAGLLVRAMSIQGYTLATTSQHAEIEIYLSYGVGEAEKHTYSYNEPVWGQTGMEIYTQTSQRNNPDTSVTQFSSTSVEPQYGVTGYTNQTKEYTAYPKYIIINAFDIKNGKQGTKLAELWKTSISAMGKSNDLRKMFPIFLAAAAKYIGINTGESIIVTIYEDSKEIQVMKGN
ncbi:MAG: hypothetical protein WCJ46_07500 [bacterium]